MSCNAHEVAVWDFLSYLGLEGPELVEKYSAFTRDLVNGEFPKINSLMAPLRQGDLDRLVLDTQYGGIIVTKIPSITNMTLTTILVNNAVMHKVVGQTAEMATNLKDRF